MSEEIKEEDREEQNQEEIEEDQDQKQDRHIPAPPPHQRHRKKHWDHLPGSKRKSIRSFKSPGRK